MSTEVGQLRASLSANSAAFASDMQKARDAVRKNAKGMEAAMYKVQDAFGGALRATKVLGAAAIAGAGVLSLMVKQSVDSADAILKMSQSSGVAIEELSALAYAGKLSGVETEALGAAMVKLTKGMADAAVGTGEAMRAYEALGINVKDANGNLKSSDTMMKEIADKFNGMEDGANKTALAVALFGKSGAAMIPMLNQGSSGLKDSADEAERLGLILDGNTAAAAERFNDNLTRLNAVKEGFSNQIMKAMLPSLEGLSKRLFESASSADSLKQASTAAATGIKLLMSSGVILVGIFKTLGEYLGGVAAAAVQLFSGNFKEAMKIASMSATDFSANIESTIGNVNAIWDAEAAKVEQNAPALGKKLAAPMMAAVGAAEQARKKIAADAEKARREEERALEKQNTDIQAAALKAQGIIADIDPVFKASLAWEEYVALVEAGYLTMEQAAAKYAQDFGGTVEKTKEATDQMTIFAEQAGRNMQDIFAEFLFDPFKGGVDGMLADFTVMLRKMAAQALASQIFSAIGGWGNSGGGSGTTFGGIVGSVFGGARADGGMVSRGTSYIVGERGPEIFTPGQSGNITPNHAMGGVTVVNNFNISQPTDRRTQEQIASMAGASIQRAMARGG